MNENNTLIMKKDKKIDILILGAGDVVKNRLWLAIKKRLDLDFTHNINDIFIHTIESIDDIEAAGWDMPEENNSCIHEETQSMFDLLVKPKSKYPTLGWIATPSDTHLYYLKILLEKADFVVVEKPIVQNYSDLLELNALLSDKSIRRRVFFLSYYILEKALILTFLKRPHPFYLKYLEGDVAEFYQAFIELGKVKNIAIKLVEKADNRKLPKGGQLLETLIHHCLISSMFIGSPKTWKLKNYKENKNGNFIEIYVVGENNETVSMELVKGFDGKQYKWKKQMAYFEFENGKLFTNFKSKTATIIKNKKDKQKIRIHINPQFDGPYDIQYDMAYRCFTQNIDPSMIDGLYQQTDALEWLLNFGKKQS